MKKTYLLLLFSVLFGVAASAQDKSEIDNYFWNRPEFWESPAMKTPFKADISEDEKIAGLSKFWSEVKYNFINFNLVPELDWDKTYLEYLPRVRAAKSTLEYYRLLAEMCARLKDGHTRIMPPNELSDQLYARPQIVTRLIEDKVVVTQILDEKLKDEGLQIGLELTEIDGVPVKRYAAERIIPYSPDSTRQAQDVSVYTMMLLAGPVDAPVVLTLRDGDGSSRQKTLPRIPVKEWFKRLPAQEPFEMRQLAGNVMYVRINTFGSNVPAEAFAKNFDTIARSDAIIFDIRENGGGNSNVGWEILTYLTDKNFKTSRWSTRRYHPAFRAWRRPEKAHVEDANEYPRETTRLYTKPVIVLTSPRTGSAAEDFAVAFRTLKRGLIVGEPTNGSTGQPLFITLPGGGKAGICTKYDSFPDGTAFVGVGVLPDISVPARLSDLTTGADAVLQAALERLAKK